jgi:hypothetical protein
MNQIEIKGKTIIIEETIEHFNNRKSKKTVISDFTISIVFGIFIIFLFLNYNFSFEILLILMCIIMLYFIISLILHSLHFLAQNQFFLTMDGYSSPIKAMKNFFNSKVEFILFKDVNNILISIDRLEKNISFYLNEKNVKNIDNELMGDSLFFAIIIFLISRDDLNKKIIIKKNNLKEDSYYLIDMKKFKKDPEKYLNSNEII